MREEVYAAMQCATKNTAPGTDKVTNALIRNLSDTLVEELTEFLNTHWEAETVPAEWKHAEVVMIPKPGKKLQIENLRPILLTLRLVKLYERVVTRRLQQYMEDNELYPHSIWFPSHTIHPGYTSPNQRTSTLRSTLQWGTRYNGT